MVVSIFGKMSKKTLYNQEGSIKAAFEDMLETYRIKNKFSEAQIVSSWDKLMGKTIASRTLRVFIKEKKLFVELTSAPLKQELLHSKERIIEIFKENYGEGIISEIVFL